jgi:hypothetical protein
MGMGEEGTDGRGILKAGLIGDHIRGMRKKDFKMILRDRA